MRIRSAETTPAESSDRISRLPDSLISSILGFLPVKEAVRSSAVSRGWRRLWTSAPRLDFSTPAADAAQPAVVDHVLHQHRGPLSGCRLLLDPRAECLDGWVARLSRKRIRSVDLDGLLPSKMRPMHHAPRSPTLPPGAFAAAADSLRHLSLRFLRLPGTDYLGGCGPNLTSLHLSCIISMTDHRLSDVLACCTRLVHLSLSDCHQLRRPAIRSPALRHLALSNLYSLKAVLVDAPAMATLTMTAVDCCERCLDVRAPRLADLITVSTDGGDDNVKGRDSKRCRCTKNLLEHFSNIMDIATSHCSTKFPSGVAYLKSHEGNEEGCKRAIFDMSMSPFGSLRRLAIHVNLSDLRQVVVLRFMLMTCECLREVKIKNGKGTVSGKDEQHLLPYNRNQVWQRPYYTECLKNFCETLYELSLTGYTGKELECEFLAFLISNAVVMRRVNVLCCTKSLPPAHLAAAARKLLSTTKRASAALVVTFNEQRVDPS